MKLPRADASVPGRGRMGRRAPLILGSVHGTRFVMDDGGFQTSARATPHRTMTTISSLEPLLGGHPHALADFYRAGRPCDPSSVRSGEGHLLAFDALANAHAAARPIVTLLGKHFSPWRGKAFESGGTAGTNLFFGKRLARFHGEVAPSLFDGQPTLLLRYDGLGNPWPLSLLKDELREVGPGVAIGPLLWKGTPVLWWGVRTAP